MIRTSGFRQLVRSPFVTFKSAFVNLPRLQIPCRASSLCRFGLDADSAEAIKDLSRTPSEEARLVAAFILIVYRDEFWNPVAICSLGSTAKAALMRKRK